jgi:hypothetical protein
MRKEHHKDRDFLTYALGYGPKLGFRVIPLRPGKKTPLIDDWPNKATWDEAQIREWWAKWPDANIGILTGRYRDGFFIVLDFDPRNGGDWWDDVGEDVLPPTWVVHTPSGGRHFYYRTSELLRGEKLPVGVDLKGEGGYVVVPPSVLYDDEGNFIGDYDFQVGNMPKELGLALYTQWGLDYFRRGRGGAGASVRSGGGDGANAGGGGNGRPHLWLMPPPIPKGMRHDYLVSLAGAFWSAGLTEREVEALLWAGLELLETLDDFEPEREIGTIVKGLQKWEGANYTIGSLLQMLPDPTARVVRRVLTGGVVSGAPVGEPVRELSGADSGAESGQVASGAAGQVSDAKGESTGDGRKSDRLALAAELVKKLETRQKEGGGICFVYRKADGTELEAACTPRAVKALLGQLGLKVTLAEAEQVLGVTKGTGEGEAKEKKGRKSKEVNVEDIKAILARYKWAIWQGELWQVTNPTIYRADLDRLHSILKQNGVDVGKETLKSHWAEITAAIPRGHLRGIVVTGEPTYGRLGALRGIWYKHRGDLYLETPYETRIFRAGEWPAGVYALDTGTEGVLPDPNGEPKHLLGYWRGVTTRLTWDKRIPHDVLQRVTLAMFLPVLFGQGHIGLILYGAARSGKSTLLKAMGYLRLGRKPRSPSGLNKRDLLAVLQRKQIVFFDEVKTITPELEEALKRMITHDGDEIRSLYTNLETVEADLQGSAVFCATSLSQLASDLRTRCFVWHLEEKEGSAYEQEILAFCEALWALALGGAIQLYRMAARLKRPPKSLLPEIRFRDWLAWAYRYAVVLGVEKEFVAFVKQAKSAAHSGTKYDFLLELLSRPDFDTSKEYTIGNLIELAFPQGDATGEEADEAKAQAMRAAKALQYALKSEAVRSDLMAMARDMGYNLRIEKKRAKGEKKPKYWFIFSKLEVPQESDLLQEILQSLGVAAKLDDDDDDAPPPETTPPIAPTPTLTPPPTPPPDNTGAGAGVVGAADAVQDETKPLTDMEREKKTTPSHLDAGESAAANGLTENIQPAAGATPPNTSAAPPKADPKKAPPPSEWVYRAGTTPQNGNNGGGIGGLFAPPQNAQPTPTSQPPTGGNTENTSQDEEYPTDDELIAYIDKRLREQAEGGGTLGGSLDFIDRFLLRFEEEMWQLKRIKSLRYIQNWVIDLQNAIKDLGYDELTPEKDPRLRTPAR